MFVENEKEEEEEDEEDDDDDDDDDEEEDRSATAPGLALLSELRLRPGPLEPLPMVDGVGEWCDGCDVGTMG